MIPNHNPHFSTPGNYFDAPHHDNTPLHDQTFMSETLVPQSPMSQSAMSQSVKSHAVVE